MVLLEVMRLTLNVFLRRTSTSFLIIQVIDINDHAPAFQQEVYTATLSEAAPVGSFVAAPQV
jgi:hypothetical protein